MSLLALLHRDAPLAAPRSLTNRRILPKQSQLLRTWRRSLPTALFRPQQLSACYPNLVRHAMTDFGSQDVMRFLGKKLTANFQGEVITDHKCRREGVRVKHVVGINSQKMYDKALPVAPVRGALPAVLRCENTMNDPSAFRVRRKAQGDPDSPSRLRPLRKSIADIRRRVRISQQANNRHANALAVVDNPARVHDLIEPVIKPGDLAGRRVRALHPWAAPDLPILNAIANGDFPINGFRNRELHAAVYPVGPATDKERRSRSAHITYLLRILRGHGSIEKMAACTAISSPPRAGKSSPPSSPLTRPLSPSSSTALRILNGVHEVAEPKLRC